MKKRSVFIAARLPCTKHDCDSRFFQCQNQYSAAYSFVNVVPASPEHVGGAAPPAVFIRYISCTLPMVSACSICTSGVAGLAIRPMVVSLSHGTALLLSPFPSKAVEGAEVL